MMFSRIISKLTGILSSNAKDSVATLSKSPVVQPQAIVSAVAIEECSCAVQIHGKDTCGNKARSRDEQRASRGTSNKGSRRCGLYLALER